MIASAVPRLFRSGRCSPCAFSARADAVRTRESTPMMIVKAARSFLCAFIRYILFTNVNSNSRIIIDFNPSIPTRIAPCYRKSTESGVLPKIDLPKVYDPGTEPSPKAVGTIQKYYLVFLGGRTEKKEREGCPSEVALGGKITAGAGKTHGPGDPDIKPVAFKCGFVDTCQEEETVCSGAFHKRLTFS